MRDIRQAWLMALVSDATTGDNKISKAAFAKKCDLSPAQLSQLLSGRRNLGDAVSRRIEDALLLDRGFLDRPIGTDDSDPLKQRAIAILSQMSEKRIIEAIEYLENSLKNQIFEERASISQKR